MPRTKSLQHYPTRYSEIVRECAVEGKITKVQLDSMKRALSMRGHWYAYVGSLKAAALTVEAGLRAGKGFPTTEDSNVLELAKLAPTVMVQVDNHGDDLGATIRFQSREHSWQAQALAGGETTVADSKPTAASFDEEMQRLLKVQKEMDDEQS